MSFEEWSGQFQDGPPEGGEGLTPEQRKALGLGDDTGGTYDYTYEAAKTAVDQLGPGWEVGWGEFGYTPVRSGGGQQDPTKWMAPGTPPTDQYDRTPTWNARTGSWDYPPDWGQDPNYQQWQQEQADRQYRSQLAAEGPMSWLKYHSYEGTQPMTREWMKPLMAQEYGWGQTGGPGGQAIPNWTAESAAGIPQLTRPSGQLWSRMGPTAQQEYAGYRQARSGIRPDELMFRRQSRTAPAGRFGGLSRTR